MFSAEEQLDSYLMRIERRLKKLSSTLRSDVISEVRAKITDLREQDPERSIADILKALGKPEPLAARCARERGFRPERFEIAQFAIGAAIVAALALMLFHFQDSGIFRVNFPGVTLIRNKAYTITTTHVWFVNDLRFSGIKSLEIKFKEADLTLRYDRKEGVLLECKNHRLQDRELVAQDDDGILMMNLTYAGPCTLTLPLGFGSKITLESGSVAISEVTAPLSVLVENGLVRLDESQSKDVRYDLAVQKGQVDSFPSSDEEDAIEVEIKVGNGAIRKA